MDPARVARTILADAERALRDLMHQELEAQRYTGLAELAAIADGLARLVPGYAPAQVPATPSPPPKSDIKTSKSSATSRDRAVGKRRSYPLFHRDGDRLIKTGWSKKSRKEYEHRVPRAAALAFTIHLGRTIKSGSTFVMESVLPASDSVGEELPSYQVYSTLAWLGALSAVKKKGRDGYVLAHKALDASAFDLLWSETPERR